MKLRSYVEFSSCKQIKPALTVTAASVAAASVVSVASVVSAVSAVASVAAVSAVLPQAQSVATMAIERSKAVNFFIFLSSF